MATLTVGTGKQYSTIAAAVAAAKDGDTVAVNAGTYVNDFATIKTKISLVAVGGLVTMQSTSTTAIAKALLTVTTDATVNGFAFTGLRTADGTGAGILYQGGNLVVQNSLFTGNQNGILATAATAGTITIQGSEFARNGNNDGLSHNVSIGAIKSLTISNSYIHDAVGGSEVCSLAASTSITGTRIEDNASAALVSVDLPNGGAVTLQGNTIEKGAAASNAAAIRFGGGTLQPGSALSVTGNTFVSDRAGATLLQNLSTVTASVSANQDYAWAAIASGPVVLSANTALSARPAVSTATLIGGVAPRIDYGRTGAVIASGHVLTVGAGQQYATLAAAVGAAVDGDTIDVSAGVYLNDNAVIKHKVIIEGVGGLARFVDTTAPTNGAQFVTTTDVTLRNVEIMGAAIPGGTAAAIHDAGGNLTIVNSDIHDNQAGVVADAGGSPATPVTVGIYDTEIARNGTVTGTGANVAVAQITTLTLVNDYVHDAVAAPEIVSAANATTLDSDRISQAAGNGGVAIDLPDAGQVSITNTAVEKGTNSTSATLIQVGALPASAVSAPTVAGVAVTATTPYAGSAVTLSNDTLITDVTTTPTTFVANTAPAAAALAVTSTTFAGGASGSVQVSGGSDQGASTATGIRVDTAAPYGLMMAPPPPALTIAALTPPAAASTAAPVTAPGQLILRVSETAFQGDAQFTLMVDGTAVGGVLKATADHASGQSQTFTIAGAYAPGPHVVTANFTNSLGSGTTARALYVDGMSFNGVDSAQTATLTANGSALLSTAPTTRSTPITVNVSEDAWHGDAQCFISIDGKVQGGIQTVTAAHGAGQTQAMSFLLDLAPGAHTEQITLLNGVAGAPGSDRSLFVDSIDVAGTHYAAAAATVGASNSSTFAFTVDPAPITNGALFVTAGAPQALSLLIPH